MAQNIILPDGPVFMVDRGWRNPHKDSAVQVVSSWGRKNSQIPRRRRQYQGPAATNLLKPPVELSASQHDAKPINGPAYGPKNWLTTARKFEFVHLADPFRGQDTEVRKLVRSHVMKGCRRSQKPRRKLAQESTALSTNVEPLSTTQSSNKHGTQTAHSSDLSLALPGSATSFYGVLPCSMEPQYYSFLNYCM
jgi:hypothetical protein